MSASDTPTSDERPPADAAADDGAVGEGRRQREHTAMQIRELREVMDAGVASYARRLLVVLTLFIFGLVAGLIALYVLRRP